MPPYFRAAQVLAPLCGSILVLALATRAETPNADANNLPNIEEEWHRNNTWKDSSLVLRISRHPTINAINSIALTMEDPSYKWISYFKGGVVAYEKRSKSYFMVYDPANQYEWVMQLREIGPWIYMKSANSRPDWSVRLNAKTFVLERGDFEVYVTEHTMPDPFILLKQYSELDQARLWIQLNGGTPSDDLIFAEARLELQIRPLLLERAINSLESSFVFKSAQVESLSNWDFDLGQSDVPWNCKRCFRFHYLPGGPACDVILKFGAIPAEDRPEFTGGVVQHCLSIKQAPTVKQR
jgi:hypothetical protein